MLLPVRRESLRVQPSQPGATYTQQLDQHVLRVEVSRSWANHIEITAWGVPSKKGGLAGFAYGPDGQTPALSTMRKFP